MPLIAILDLISFLFLLTAFILVLHGWRAALRHRVRLIVAGLTAFSMLYSLCLLAEWSGITEALEPVEDLAGGMVPMWWAFVLYALLRERAERVLRESEERFRTLFEGINDTVLVHDEEGRILDCNDTACRRLGFPRHELLRMTARDINAPESVEGFKSRLRRQLAAKRSHFEGVHVTEDGRHVPVDINTSLIDYGGKAAVLTVARDITRRKRAERERRRLEEQVQQAQKLESLGVLAGGIAHDFNNLLMGVLGNADLAIDKIRPDSPAFADIEEIMKTSRHASDLCRQLLAYSGRGKFVVEPVDIGRLVKEMTDLLEVSISKRASLKYEFAGDLPAVESDATQIRQIILNLITNASEAMGEKDGIIIVRTGVMDADSAYLKETYPYVAEDLPEGPYVYLEVVDTGCGMDRETQRKIFDPFYTTKFTGRGLGLAAVLGIVRGHKGGLRVSSEPGKGSTFKVLFPAYGGPATSIEEKEVGVREWRGSGTVLLIDDTQTVRDVATRMLERAGFTVVTAEDGAKGVEEFRKHLGKIVCVLLDLTMPHMDGQQTLGELRRMQRDIPVIISSGYNEQDVARQLVGRGATGFVQKPYQSGEIIAALKEALDDRSPV